MGWGLPVVQLGLALKLPQIWDPRSEHPLGLGTDHAAFVFPENSPTSLLVPACFLRFAFKLIKSQRTSSKAEWHLCNVPVGTQWPAGPPCPAPGSGGIGRSRRAGATVAMGHSQGWHSPRGHGAAWLCSGSRDPVFGVWAAVVVFLVPRSHGQIALFALTRK